MPLINFKINLSLTWFDRCVLSNYVQATEFAITDIKIYVPVVTLSTQDMQKYYNNWNQGLKEQYFLFLENSAGRRINIQYYLPKVEIKNYNVIIDGENVFHQPVKNSKTYDNMRKIATGLGDNYTTVCLLD